MTKNQEIWRHIRIVGLILSLMIIVLLTIIYVLLLYQLNHDVQTTLLEYFQTVIANLIPSLIIVAASLWILHYIQEFQEIDKREILVSKIAEAVSKGESIADYGLCKIWREFPIHRLGKCLKNAQHVWVLTTWLQEPFQNGRAWAEVVTQNGGIVEILMLRPDSPMAKQRGIDLGHGENYVKEKICAAANELDRLCKKHQISTNASLKDKFIVKYYDALPSLYFVRCDDIAFVGFYWHHERATQSPIFEFQRVSGEGIGKFLDFLQDEFDRFNEIAQPLEVALPESDLLNSLSPTFATIQIQKE